MLVSTFSTGTSCARTTSAAEESQSSKAASQGVAADFLAERRGLLSSATAGCVGCFSHLDTRTLQVTFSVPRIGLQVVQVHRW